MILAKKESIVLLFALSIYAAFSGGCTSTKLHYTYSESRLPAYWQTTVTANFDESINLQNSNVASRLISSFAFAPSSISAIYAVNTGTIGSIGTAIDTYRNLKAVQFKNKAFQILQADKNKIKPVKTQWGTPWNHLEICRNMNSILLANGVNSAHVRVRMISHAIIASGWRQNVWNYNAWGVQQGSWSGLFYEMNTVEAKPDGSFYLVKNAPWRSFSSWSEAVADYKNRIHPNSKRPSYRQANRYLNDPGYKADSAYWSALGNGNYYTTKEFTDKKFAMLCREVRSLLAN